jgi:hypothetical protein
LKSVHRQGLAKRIHCFVVFNEANLTQEQIRKLRWQMVSEIKRQARKSGLKYRLLATDYIFASMFHRDFRIRRMKNFGLGPELLGTLTCTRSKRIKVIDIYTGIPEQLKRIRLVWNSKSVLYNK